MGKLSRDSGARGERQVRDLFKAAGYDAERGCQHDGRTGHADVEGVPYLHIESKFYATVTPGLIEKAVEQSERDAAAGSAERNEILLPIVVHKQKGSHGWQVSMRLLTLTDLLAVQPFSVNGDLDGIVTMEWDVFIKLFIQYEEWRRQG